MEEKQETITQKKSFDTLQRIDAVLKTLNESSLTHNVVIKQRALYALWMELDPFLLKHESKQGHIYWGRLKSAVWSENNKIWHEVGMRDNLHNFEMWLRRKLKEKDLLFVNQTKGFY